MSRNEKMHELLCAYVLGEASENERAEVEEALAASAELRAEKARLEGTIGLVRDAYAGEPTLSEDALAEVMSAAGAKPVRAIQDRPAFRAAAAVLALVGGVWALLRLGESGAVAPPTVEVAQAEKTAGRVLAEIEALTLDRIDPYGVKEPNVQANRKTAGGDPAVSSEGTPVTLNGGELRTLYRYKSNGFPEDTEWSGQNLYDMPRQLIQPEPVLAERDAGETWRADAIQSLGAKVDSYSNASLSASELEELRALGYGGNDGTNVNAVGEPALSSGDDFFLGQGERSYSRVQLRKSQGDAEASKEVVRQRLEDKARAGGAGGGGAQGPAGPGSPGPASPGAPANSLGGQSGVYRRAVPAPATQQPEALSQLGYVPAPEEEVARGIGALDDAVDGWVEDRNLAELRFAKRTGELNPHDFDRWCELETQRRLRDCYRRPREQPSAMYFRFWGDNAFELAQLDSLSTFSVDVDTASYALARRYLEENHLPQKAQIRTEEFLNYFEPDLDPPTEDTFAIHTELAPSLFGGREDRWMLRVGVRGREVSASERKPLALTFVIDTSGSMKEGGRLELVKHALRLLLGQLDGRDSIAIVAFNKEPRLILPMTSAAQRGLIESAIHPLSPGGNTNAEGGLKMGYELALSGLATGVHNRVVLLSDGVANVGQTDQDRINADVARHRAQGIYLNTIGVGMNNHNDVFLEQLANKGDGICDYIDDAEAARRAIVDRFTGAFEPIASDVKIQVEFDPNQVHRYRLLGYENRAIADKDFRNDAVDAGEVGAGHQVVALYEIERTSAAADGPVATVRLRWKAPKIARQDPNEADVTEIEHVVLPANAAGSFEATSAGYRRSVLVAQFAELLRRSTHTLGDSYERLLGEAARLEPELADPEFNEFRGLVQRAGQLILSSVHPRSELDRALDEFRRFQILKAELEDVRRGEGSELLEDLKGRNQELESRIRHLIRKDLEERNG